MSSRMHLTAWILVGWTILEGQAEALSPLPEPVLEWTFDAGAGLEATPVPYPAAKPDSVLVGMGGRVLRIDGKGKVLFDSTFGPEKSRGGIGDVSVADLDGGGPEEIVGVHKEGYVAVLEASGNVRWTYDLGESLGTWQLANAGDLDADGKAEVLVSDLGGWVTCLDGVGHLRWRTRMTEDVWEISTPAIGDLDADGSPEIVYGTQTRNVVALDADGALKWKRAVPPLHLGRTMPLLADNDGDGIAEVYVMSSMLAKDGGVACLDGRDGHTRWTGPTDTNVYHGRSLIRFNDGARGIVVGDKGNCVSAFAADGARRWRTDVSGHGIWQPPAVADLDGDGQMEVVVTVREQAVDGSGMTWYVLDASTGERRGAYANEGNFGGACVADIDEDGVLEVIIPSRKGKVAAYSFGGPATADAVVAGSWRTTYPTGLPAPQPLKRRNIVLESYRENLPQSSFGHNPLPHEFHTRPAHAALQIMTTRPDGSVQTEVQTLPDDAKTATADWLVLTPGWYTVTTELIDIDTFQSVGGTSDMRELRDPAAAMDYSAKDPLWKADEIRKSLLEKAPEAALGLAALCETGRARYAVLQRAASKASELSDADRRRLVEKCDAVLADLERLQRVAELTAATVDVGEKPSFVLWPDENPWDNVPPLDTLPQRPAACVVDAWAFGNETESVCINAANLGVKGLTLRVGPCAITRDGQPVTAPALRLLRPAWLPSRYGEVVPDMLPPLGDGYLLDVAPGEAQQIWININTRGLEPGAYELKWPVSALDASIKPLDITVKLDVSRVALPEKSRYLANHWSRNSIDNVSTIPDLNEHLQNVWYGFPLPAATCDANGELTGELDWSQHDALIREVKQIGILFYGAPPSPAFPEGVTVTDELRLKARRNYAKAMVEHLQSLGIGYDQFMFYPEDEPGLRGDISNYMKAAAANKAIDPKFQNYANPWGSVNLAKIEEMASVTDVWQPGMDVIEQLGPESVAAMRKGGKRVLTYTPPGNARILKPLGFYRAQPWVALYWGLDGGGWWTYYQGDDLYSVDPAKEPTYGAVNWDGRALTASRRWEAARDGIEDFNAVVLLRERAQAKGDAEALRVAQEAIDYVGRTAITGMPREAAPYDLDAGTLAVHRARIRIALEGLQP